MEDAAHDQSKGVVSGNLFINTDHVRQALYRKKIMEYQKDKDVVKSVKLWFKDIEDKGGKTMFVEDATLTGFAYGWCTKFQRKVNVVHAGSIHTWLLRPCKIIYHSLFLHLARSCPRTPISTALTQLTRQ